MGHRRRAGLPAVGRWATSGLLIHPGRLSDWGHHQSTVQAAPTSRDTPDTDHHAGGLPSTHTPCLGKPVSPTTSRVNQFNLATSPFPNLPAITSKPQLRKSHLAPLLPDFSAYKNISKSTEVGSHSFIRIIHAHNKHILGTSYMPGTRRIRQTRVHALMGFESSHSVKLN